MRVYLSKEQTKEIFEKFGGSASNTGSTEGRLLY